MARRVQRRHGVKTDMYQAIKTEDMPSENIETKVQEEPAEAAPVETVKEEIPVKTDNEVKKDVPEEKGESKRTRMKKDKGFLNSLNRVREPDTSATITASVLSSILVLIFGVMIGVIAQAAQVFGENSTIWWQDVVKDLQFNVVFTKFPIWFLLGLTVAVCSQRPLKAAINELIFFIGTIVGRFVMPHIFHVEAQPENITTWVLITIISIPLAVIFWYAKSRSIYSIVFDAIILGVLAAWCFDCGMIYFHFTDMIMDLFNAIIIALVAIVLATGVVQVVFSLIGAVIIAMVLGPMIQMH